ncbi:unnamed protein product [Amoebophrya sp. A120]|nr:unnamed protein product [Amoebophrya sp. A120]|eukprot:GSA120T00011961001.1
MLSAFPHRFETEDNSYDIVRSAWVNGAHYFACGENRESGAFLDVYKDGKRLEYTGGGGPGGSCNKSSNAPNTSISTSSSPTGDAGATTSNSTRLKVSDTTICLLTALEFVPGYNTAQKSDLLLAAGFSHGGVSLFHTENLECILAFSLKPGFVISSFGFTGVVELDKSGGSGTASAASAAGSASASHKTTDEEEDALFWIVHNHIDTQTLSSNLRKWHAAAQQATIKAAAATSSSPSSSPTGDGSGAPGGSSAITIDGTSNKEQIEQGRFSRTNSGPKSSNPLFDPPRPRGTGSSDGGATPAFSSTRPAPGTAVVKKAGVTTVKNFGQQAAGSSTEKNAEGTSSSKTPYPHDPSSELADQDRSFVARVPFACIRQAVAKTFPVPESANFRAELLEFPIEFQLATTLFFRRNMVKEFSPTDLAFFNGGGGSGGNLYVSDLRRGLELAASAEEEELIMSTRTGGSTSPRTSQLSGRSAGRENHGGTSSRSNLPSAFAQAGQTVKSSSSTAATARQQLYQKNLLKQHDRNQVLAVGRNPMIAKCDNMYNDPKNAPSVSALVGSAVDFFMGRFAGTTTAAKSPGVRFNPLKESARDRVSAGYRRSTEIQFTEKVEEFCLSASAQLEDGGRHAIACAADPRRKYLAIADNLGRVGLYCIDSLRCLHLWRGYRDAQVAFVSDTYLAILATRRGLLEVWHLQTLQRLRAWNLMPVRGAAGARAGGGGCVAGGSQDLQKVDLGQHLDVLPRATAKVFPRLISSSTTGVGSTPQNSSTTSSVLVLRKKRDGTTVFYKLEVPSKNPNTPPGVTSATADDVELHEFDSAQED